jgi:hypothetical protein
VQLLEVHNTVAQMHMARPPLVLQQHTRKLSNLRAQLHTVMHMMMPVAPSHAQEPTTKLASAQVVTFSIPP